MKRHPRLDRLEQVLGTAVCDPCGRARHGTMEFVLTEAEVAPEDLLPCPGCRQPRVFVPEMGRDDEDTDS